MPRQGRESRLAWEAESTYAALDALLTAATKANHLLLAMAEDRGLTLSVQAARAASELHAALNGVDRCRLEVLP